MQHLGLAMPKGPKGDKRPADVIGNAVKVMRIAVGDEADEITSAAKGRKLGGLARSQKLTSEQRRTIAKNAASIRWKKT